MSSHYNLPRGLSSRDLEHIYGSQSEPQDKADCTDDKCGVGELRGYDTYKCKDCKQQVCDDCRIATADGIFCVTCHKQNEIENALAQPDDYANSVPRGM